MEAQKVTELTIEEEDKEHLHLPLLVSSRCVSSEFPTRFCSKAGSCSKRLVKYCSRGKGSGHRYTTVWPTAIELLVSFPDPAFTI